MIYGQLLILALVIITELRVFFVKQAKKDSLVFLAPVSFILSILLIISWGLNIINIIVLSLSLIAFICSIYSLFKYLAKLLTDSYSSLSKVTSLLITILSLTAIVFAIIYAPVNLNLKKIGTTEIKENYEGNFRSGFEPVQAGSLTTATFYQYSEVPDIPVPRHNVVVLITDKRADAQSYIPYMAYLSKQGFTVCTMDFFTNDLKWFNDQRDSKPLRRFFMLQQSIYNSEEFNSQENTFVFNHISECDGIITFLEKRFGPQCKYFLIGDGMTSEAVKTYATLHSNKISGYFCLDSIPEYKTPGYGCVELTDPLLANILNQKKDSDGFITKYLVLKSSEAIRKSLGLKQKPASKGNN